ncbi:head-tail connector protein [Bacillus wiedmannii]|uniref:head-tail connector protein n=1 Tax=Bacillus wiedmannii TaxID=1890302 RepID=UPI000BF23BBA|nr:head-tail connector protein [Bacillus wiedmannii]PEJ40068.1 hypothetical protein CN889_18135 [Bacillus wiedmannii]
MTLEELKIRLKISSNDSAQDEYLGVALEDALEYVQSYCRQEFAEGIPSGVKQAIAKLVKGYQENSNVQSQSLGDMSKSFATDGTMNEVHRLLKPYRKVRFR